MRKQSKIMAKKKRYEFQGHGYDLDDGFERRAKKKAVRDEHKEHWKFNPREDYGDSENEAEDWEGHHPG